MGDKMLLSRYQNPERAEIILVWVATWPNSSIFCLNFFSLGTAALGRLA